ncbi:DNA polymerase III subunit alpha [Amphibacillus sp. MSJ-3]|uniref:DNA polymerase III subunit alpha n=1 Tax=Amphibacillus sp. MSJ-3 TaxID=2841505 RepID=UPI001C0F051B|nr:DNA polymerase III subunit alpha [Amphibacillus sp. MSJ-3]MBU5593668.1 DNA polymerase III subunit alpha [Amphibacillus sp. MSJ-3]
MSFVHLQVKSGYTFMNSTIKIDQLIKKAKREGMSAVALTDQNVLHGAIEFYLACQAEGITPIIGMETTVEVKDQLNQVIVLAKNNNGYRALMQISSIIQTSELPKIPLKQFNDILTDCLVILPIQTTNLNEYVKNNDQEAINEFMHLWPDKSLIGLTRFELDFFTALNELSLSMVALGDVYYLEQTDQQAYFYLRAIDKKNNLKVNKEQSSHHFFTKEEAFTYFRDYPGLIDQTVKIANACQLKLTFDQQLLPRYPLEEGQDASFYLQELCEQALTERYPDSRYQQAKVRLEYELSIINQMNFNDYFLIVWDFVRYAKSHDILVGPGRGSAAGSLVAYLLEITNIDPIKYELLFERFLNPERISMPDIDIDFSDYRRNEVIDYVKEKYGDQFVAQIGTFGTFKIRSTIRELAKVFELSNEDLTFILNEIPSQGVQTIAQAIKSSQTLLDYIKQNEYLQNFFKIANQIEGLPRNMSTHAAGVIIHDQVLTEFVPLISDGSGNLLTQYAMTDIEKIGLLKIDFLGLRNLTTIERILKMITRYEHVTIDLNKISLNDQATFLLFQEGKTNGIFQFESQGMKNVLKNLKPNTFEEVVAVNALYRPGPMDFIDTYIRRKHQIEEVSYVHQDLKPILSSTYGVLIYQEQIMQLAHHFAGLNLGKADLLRRAVSKKNRIEIEELKQQFIEGCLAKGYSSDVAEEVFSWIIRFANYGFNRSHAVAYSMIAYYLAYLKANYPVYFLTELLNTVTGEKDKLAQYIKEAKQQQIKILAPTINKSHYYFQPENGKIRMGLSSIKGISYPVVNEIIQERRNGSFKSIFDFCLRVSMKVVKRATIETLVLAGVFDEFGVERASILASIDQAIEQGELFGGLGDQKSLFGDRLNLEDSYREVEPFDLLEKLNYEKDLLGLYVSDHPLEMNRRKLRSNGIMDFIYFYQNNQIKNIAFSGLVQSIKVIRTKRGESMAFVQFMDEHLEVEGVVFPNLYRDVKPWLEEQMFVIIKGKKELRHGKAQLIVQEISPLNLTELATANEYQRRLFIKVDHSNQLDSILVTLGQLAKSYPGSTPVLVHQADVNKTFILAEQYNLSDRYPVIELLRKSFGQENVVLK